MLAFLRSRPDVTRMRIEAHTDNVGSYEVVLRLQRERARVVARWLTEHGVDCRRLDPLVVEDRPPVVCNTCDPGPQRRRKIAFHVAALRGAPAFGQAPDGAASAGDPCTP